ncbi:MAG: hypothetical protein DRJ66_04690 [Thermoprotei archaeon]|nr:MAG: hypothetical protein DRJ66_04690 [Thermoprotei archaeon]
MISRRDFFKIIMGALLMPIIGRLLFTFPRKRVVRPPGAIKEDDFLRACIRCGMCIEACSRDGTGTLEPCGILDGIPLMGTPKVNPLKAPCEARYGRCEGVLPCVKACPTSALKWIEPDRIKLGSVEWNPKRCIAVLHGDCLVCAEVCPVPGAITIRRGLPVFHSNKCIGCGRCVNACPAHPKALKLTPKGERRST